MKVHTLLLTIAAALALWIAAPTRADAAGASFGIRIVLRTPVTLTTLSASLAMNAAASGRGSGSGEVSVYVPSAQGIVEELPTQMAPGNDKAGDADESNPVRVLTYLIQ